MKRRAFLAGAAALAAAPALPAGPVTAGEWWTPEVLGAAMSEPAVFFAGRVFWVSTAGQIMQYSVENDPEKWGAI